MSRRVRRIRSLLLTAINLFLLGLLIAWGAVRPFAAEPGDDTVVAVPDFALVVEGKAVQVRILRQTSNFSLNALGQVQFGPTNLSSAAEMELELTGEVTVTLANSPTEVLSGATVRYEIPRLGLRGTLTESSTGRYTGRLTTRAILRSELPLNQVDSGIASWRPRSFPGFVNNRLATTFSFLDYRANTVFSGGHAPSTYDLPVNLLLQGRILTASGAPVAGKILRGRLELPTQGYAETVQMSSDSQGRVEYERQETVRLFVERGSLQTLSTPVRFNPPSRTLTVVDPSGVSRQYTLPLALSSSSPVVLFWWGQINKAVRELVTTLLKKAFGQPLTGDHVAGKDPVDLTTGNVYTTFVDFSIPGRGLGLAFERSYNSRDDTVGPLGFGWTHSYNVRLVKQEDGSLAEIDEDGTWRFYAPQPDGSFLSPPGEHGVLSKRPDGSYRLRRKGGLVLAFLPDGKLSFQEDPNGNRVSLTYSASGLLTSIADPAGRQAQLFYDASNRIIRLRDPAGREVTYTYTGQDLTASTDPEGKRTDYTYDEVHQLLEIRDARGFLRTFTYDSSSRARSFSYEQQQHKVVLSYDPDRQDTVVQNARAFRTIHHWEEIAGVRLVTSRTDAIRGVTRSTWDAQHNRTSITDPLGRMTRFAYDARGNLVQVTDPAGNATILTYEPGFDRLASATDALGRTTTYSYDPRGNLLEVRNPLSETTRFAYDGSGQLVTVTDPRGQVATYAYDAQGNLSSLTDPAGRATRFAADAVGNVLSVTDPQGRVTRFAYDGKNRLTRITGADGSVTAFAYDAVGNRVRSTDPAGLETAYRYDLADRLVKVTDPAAQATRYQYDPEGNLIRVTDAENRQTNYGYDGLDRLAHVRDGRGQTVRYEYNAAGNRVKEVKSDGTVLSYTYDSLNRLASVSSLRRGGAPQAISSFAYDALGRRTAMTGAGGTTAYSYDAVSRLLSVDGPSANDTVAYEYDAAGNRTRMTDPLGGVTGYTYDALNRLAQVSLRGPGGAEAISSFSYTYDAAGNLVSLGLPNGLTTAYSYDSLNRLTRILSLRGPAGPEAISLLDLAYSYDAAGRRARVQGAVPSLSGTVPVTVDYTYDAASRLTGERRTQSSPYAIAYRYDKAGNRARFQRDGVATLWTVDGANRLVGIRREGVAATVKVMVSGTSDDTGAIITVDGLTAGAPDRTKAPIHWSREVEVAEGEHVFKAVARDSLGNQTSAEVPVTVVDPTRREFLHDANGSLVEELAVGTGARTVYSYDALSRLKEVQGLSPQGTVPVEIARYVYDGEGKRISVTESGVTTTYLYDGLLPILERQGSATTARNVWGLSYGGGIGGLLCRYQPQAADPNARTLYPLYDGSGNVLAWADDTGAIASTTSYTAFGEVVSSSLRGGAEAISFGFSTKPFSGATGLSYFGARYYRPDLSRWLTPDPLGQLDGPNVYLYVGNNPLNLIDPWGLLKQFMEEQLWEELTQLEKTSSPTFEQLKRIQDLLDEISIRETIRPVPLHQDPIVIGLTGLKPSIPFKINVPGLSEPTHIGLDFWGRNILHYGRSAVHLPGRHIGLWFNEKGTALLHIYRDRAVIVKGGRTIIRFYKDFFR